MDSMEHPEPQVTSASDIRKRAEQKKLGETFKLPSGFVVKVSQPNLSGMVKNGYLPSDLIQIALGQSEGVKTNPKDIPKFFEFLDKMVIATVMKPKIVEKEPKEDQILITDLQDDDKFAIFNWWKGGEGEDLDSFRKGEQADPKIARPSMQEVSKPKTE